MCIAVTVEVAQLGPVNTLRFEWERNRSGKKDLTSKENDTISAQTTTTITLYYCIVLWSKHFQWKEPSQDSSYGA